MLISNLQQFIKLLVLGSAVGKSKAQKLESLENAITTFARSQQMAASILSN
jgi:hypothetical protein